MSDKLLRVGGRVLLGIFFLVTIILVVIFLMRLDGNMSKMEQASVAEPLLYWTYILTGIATALALLFPIYDVILNPRKAVKLLVSLGAVGLIVGIAYLLSDATPIHTATSATNPAFSDKGVLLFSDTGIITSYILFGIAVLLLAITGVRSSLMK